MSIRLFLEIFEGGKVFFITMVRFRQKPKKSDMEKYKNIAKDAEKIGAKIHSMFFTLGRYDAVLVS